MMGKCGNVCYHICSLPQKLFYLWPKAISVSIWKDITLRRIAILYFVTFYIILPLICYDLPHSMYFMKNNYTKKKYSEVLRAENDVRIQKAEQYFAMLNRTKLHSALENYEGQLDIFLAVITVSRNRHSSGEYKPKYLSQVVWKFMELLHIARTQGFNRSVKMAVCNVDMDPNEYSDPQELKGYLQVINRFEKLSLSMDHPLEKEKDDYVFCLNATLQYKPRYALLIEDDALPHDDFFHVLDRILTVHIEHEHNHLSDDLIRNHKQITYAKLYHPERLLGYLQLEPERLSELLGICFLFGTILYKIHNGIFQTEHRAVVWVLLGLYSAAVAGAIGRANLVELRRIMSPHFYTYLSAPECCTPAMLFPYAGAEHIISYLDAATCGRNYGKDMVLEVMKKTQNITTAMVQPNMISHIGMYSSLRDKVLDPFVV